MRYMETVFIIAIMIFAILIPNHVRASMPVDLDESGIIDFSDFAILASQWLSCNNPTDPLCVSSGDVTVLKQDFESFPVGSIGWGTGSVANLGGKWFLLGTWLENPSVTTADSHSGARSLKLSCGNNGQNAGAWTLAASVRKNTPFNFVAYVKPKIIGSQQGSWKAYVNNYNYVQYDYSETPFYSTTISDTGKAIGWYLESLSNILVWDGIARNWVDTGANCPASQWTGIKLSVTIWDDGSGTGYYNVYVDSGSGFNLVLSNTRFRSYDMMDAINSVFIKPVGPAGSEIGYVDDVCISTAVAPNGCSDIWNVWDKNQGLWADINNDCYVDYLDISQLASNWLVSEGSKVLDIQWREGPEYPLGIQDCAVGIVNGKLICAGGFSRFPRPEPIMTPGNNPYWPDAFGGESSGFTKLTLMFDPDNEAAGWTRIADVPGSLRQAAAPAVVDGNEMYIVGGFDYSDISSYRTCYRLRQVNGSWTWDTIASAVFPWNVNSARAVVVGKKIYMVTGADYFMYPGAAYADFHTEAGRVKTGYPNGTPVGKALMVLDTNNLAGGWQRLADMPGTPRCNGAVELVQNKIYVLGGAFAPSSTASNAYCNVTDNWVYDIATNTWSRLVDMPFPIANTDAVPFNDRYIILLGGFKYQRTRYPDESTAITFTDAERQQWLDDWTYFFWDSVLVYDTETDSFTNSDTLLDRSSTFLATINGGTIYVIGGEGGRRLWHPAIFQIGTVGIK